jgi:hypothetical protein
MCASAVERFAVGDEIMIQVVVIKLGKIEPREVASAADHIGQDLCFGL